MVGPPLFRLWFETSHEAGARMFPDLTADDIFRIETKRLWLRWPRASDAPTITSFVSLAQVARMTASGLLKR